MKRFVLILLLCGICCVSLLSGQNLLSEDTPVWLLMEQGKEAYENRDFGDAFRMFRAALEKERYLPEAYMWMARIYEEEGEYDLAERHYLLALSYEKDLYIPEEKYLIQYRLADLYEISKQYGKYEKILRDILASDELTLDKIALRNAMMRNLKESGIDKMVELYRIDISRYYAAYGDLGVFYYRTGRHGEAVDNLGLAVLHVLSACATALGEADPLYGFTGTAKLLEDCLQKKETSGYLIRSDFYKYFYYLGCALFGAGEPAAAREIWMLVKNVLSSEREWAFRSSEQLRSPYIEPILTFSP